MELYNENYYQNSKKKSKVPIIIGICIIVLLIITGIIIYLILFLKESVLKIELNGVKTNQLEQIFYFNENNSTTKIYIPIRKFAQFVEYESFNGDYNNKSEDKSKCYVKNENEIVQFSLDSDILIKIRENSDYENVKIDEKVFEKDGELYTTINGVEKAYNLEFNYDIENNKITIYTLDFLVQAYASNLKLEEGSYSTEFVNEKAILENMMIVNKDGQFGVINASNGNVILETKYEEISYLPYTTDFLVKSNGKYGIIDKDSKIKVKILYDEIKIIDNNNELYLVKSNGLYGVINTVGNIVIKPMYQQIGFDTKKFDQNAISNNYVFFDELIPVKSNNLWGFYDIKGNKITEFEYTNLGCNNSKDANKQPVLLIPSYKLIVVEKDKMYNLIKLDGKQMIPIFALSSVYKISNTETGENTFFMTVNGKDIDIEKRMEDTGEN